MILKYLTKKFYMNLLLILSIFLFDRFSKLYVIKLYERTLDTEIFNSSFLNITLIWNSGIAFGFLPFQDELMYNAVTILVSLIILIIIGLLFNAKKLQFFSYLMIIGGAFGNLFDRVIYKSVPDFIEFHYSGFHWFVFNVADIFISIGVICLIFDEVFLQKQRNE